MLLITSNKTFFFSVFPAVVCLPIGTVHPPLSELVLWFYPAGTSSCRTWRQMVYFIWCFCVFSETFMGLCQVSKMMIINMILVLPALQLEEYCKSCFSYFGAFGIGDYRKIKIIFWKLFRFSRFFGIFLQFLAFAAALGTYLIIIGLLYPSQLCFVFCIVSFTRPSFQEGRTGNQISDNEKAEQ